MTKDPKVVKVAAVIDEFSTASTNNSKQATQSIAPAAKPNPTLWGKWSKMI